MNWFNKLPGFQRTPYGFELKTLKLVPHMLVAGTLLPALMSWLSRFYFTPGPGVQLEKQIQSFDFLMIGVAVFIWTAVLTIAIFCVIVWLMKGPAYVADAYNVSHSDCPKS